MPGRAMTHAHLRERGFSGIRVIPDVHGDFDAYQVFVAEARDRKLFVMQLGDVADRGDKNPECLDLTCDLAETGDGEWIMGNHCWKMIRAFMGKKVQYKPDGNSLGKTLRQLEARPDRDDLVARILKLAETMPHWVTLGKNIFAHGAVHPRMIWEHGARDELEMLALYGQTRSRDENGNKIKSVAGMPTRIFDWANLIPEGYHAVVGHQVMSREKPVQATNEIGGMVTFLDTGAGFPDGHLSYLDLPLLDEG